MLSVWEGCLIVGAVSVAGKGQYSWFAFVSSRVSFGRLCLFRNWLVCERRLVFGIYQLFSVCGICGDISTFISDISNFFLVSPARGLSILLIFSKKNQLMVSLTFSVFLVQFH